MQEITLEVMERKPAMIASLSPKTAEDAPLHDDGSIPGDGLGQSHYHHYHYLSSGAANDSSVFTITEKAPSKAFSWLKVPTIAFTFKTLLRHYAKRTLTPR